MTSVTHRWLCVNIFNALIIILSIANIIDYIFVEAEMKENMSPKIKHVTFLYIFDSYFYTSIFRCNQSAV